MMTFEHLYKTPIKIEAGAPFICLDEKAYEQVQLDAFKAGALWATEIHMEMPPSEHYECTQELKKAQQFSKLPPNL